ncbi:TrmH family RNA methyltransferase [Spiroplasma taiwanense]|uniref:RNA methyltransferase, TrmH family n=1 Tax=Spiroplasma taiwanense CT-1 TaxID=1276220 RepID=S5LUK7_9MOLU|nr:RNA methyltransferase [Spiroplasma taiwanense]AGR41484.1 RNA methyltransferase, TrmH family [Spiroplasma taiwanense CT-1]
MQKITSVANKLIQELILLKEISYQKETKKYLIEGLKMVDLAISKGVVESIFIEKQYIDKYKDFTNSFEITDNISKKISSLKSSQGIFAICKIQDFKEIDSNYLILDGIQDPGNLGTLLRSALAFEFKNIICSNDCVNFYNSKVLRATQSNHFELNLINTDLKKFLEELIQKEVVIIGTILQNESNFNYEKIKKKKIALILGNEGNGISKEVRDLIQLNAKIKINPEVESLNVGVAGSILMNEIYSKNKGV